MSVWNLNEKKRKYVELDRDIEVDILIIGGGKIALYLGEKLIQNKCR